MPSLRLLASFVIIVVVAPGLAGAGELFDVTEIPAGGRAVAAELVDLDGDGRTDLLVASFKAFPPAEQRVFRVHLQGSDGSIPLTPSFEVPIPAGVAVYDLADVAETAGTEIVLLRQSDVVILSLATAHGAPRILPFSGVGSVGAAEDERGLERFPLVYDGLGGERRLLVPLLGETLLLSASGEVQARLHTGGRANYLIPARPGLFFIESDLRLFFDTPRVSVADVDGDGSADIVSSTRHDVRVFLRRPDGGFDREPTRVHSPGLVTEKDHIRGSGGVSVLVQDVNGDGRADLLLSYFAGGLTDARMRSAVVLNREGTWNLATRDWEIDSGKHVGTDMLIDANGDGRPELLRMTVEFSVLKLVKTLLTRSIDAEAAIYLPASGGVFEQRPWVTRDLDVPIDFDTLRARGFLPNWSADLNADGHLDLLTSGGGDEIEVSLGGPERRYEKRDGRQKLDTRGQVRCGDLDGDRLTDVVIFDPYRSGPPVRLLRNRGVLPGSPPRIANPPAPPTPSPAG
jgi:FG-GAP-like repeat